MRLDETMTFDKFITSGGMVAREREAAAPVILDERRLWLPILEGWLATALAGGDVVLAALIAGQVTRARRGLNLPPSTTPDRMERRREQTRDRVRRHRARLKARAQTA